MRTCFALFVLPFAAALTRADESASPPPLLTFLPGPPVVTPLVANPQEPRVGLRKQFGSSRMKLDIGSSLDFLELSPSADGSERIRLGADFFTYALTTSSQGLRLQVDAVDGFFGGHIVYRSESPGSWLGLRLRLMHLSAHFLDGHYDNVLGQWKDGRAPVPFTRDFGELTGMGMWNLGGTVIRGYAGFSYSTLIRPVDINRFSTLSGVELHSLSLPGSVFGKPASLYLADNLTVAGVPAWTGTNTLEMGIKFGAWDGSGVRIYASYEHGREVFSQYYNVLTDQWGLGFAFDVR